uniref:Uncharacterized protein n=1 Tax=Anguilla anguilla TaxID=7936 RepID=A0A0E9TU13_ANGAN
MKTHTNTRNLWNFVCLRIMSL